LGLDHLLAAESKQLASQGSAPFGCFLDVLKPTNPAYEAAKAINEGFAVPNLITLYGNLGWKHSHPTGVVNFDFSLFKNNYTKRISDRFNAQFRAEFFNVLNHANFAHPWTTGAYSMRREIV